MLDNFDETRGVNTCTVIPPCGGAFGTGYRPIDPEIFASLLEHLGENPEDLTFVDVGCGQGRALILAAEAGFRKIVGVELSPALCDAARKNLAIAGVDAEVVCQNAADFRFPQERSLVFLYHPFFDHVMRQVMAHIHPDGYLAYVSPRYPELVPFRLLYADHLFALWRMK